MSFNSVCNHTRDKQLGLPLRGRPILMINKVLLPLLIIGIIIIVIIISNSNWTEWSTIQGVIERVISKSDEREARGRFEITSTITP